jgi:hypothetical protein
MWDLIYFVLLIFICEHFTVRFNVINFQEDTKGATSLFLDHSCSLFLRQRTSIKLELSKNYTHTKMADSLFNDAVRTTWVILHRKRKEDCELCVSKD